MFFILGTGRCGTLSLANTLLEQTSCVCLHEPEPALIAEASAYRYGDVSGDELVALLRATRSPALNHKPYGESNQNLSLVIPALEEAFAGARYVWLLRSGLDVVASLVGRGEYSGGLIGRSYEQCTPVQRRWIDGRIRGDRCGDVSQEQWQGMTAFEKCCWYWSYVNRTIEQDLQAHIDQDRACLVTLESLPDQVGRLVDWLGLEPYSTVQMRRENRASYHLHRCDTWSPDEWKAFEQWCGPLMDRLYPDWRACRQSFADEGTVAPCTVEPVSVSDAVALNREGERCFQAGDLAGARECFLQALQHASAEAETYNNLGVCQWSLGETGEALLSFGKGLEHAPDDRQLVLNASRALEASGRGDDARALLTSYLSDFPADRQVAGRLDDLDTISATETVDTVDADTLNALGEDRFACGEFEAAREAFEDAVATNPEHTAALNNLGVLHWQEGDVPKALDCLRRAMEQDPARGETLQNLVTVVDALGARETASILRARVRDLSTAQAASDGSRAHARIGARRA
jgi:Flp pilus assembly protein TadD